MLRHYGVVYDVGWRVYGVGDSSVEPFVPEHVRHDMRIIAQDLHANAVRIEGEDLGRLRVASEAAITQGLSVWLSPWKMNVGQAETDAYLVEAAKLATRLQQGGGNLTFIVGCEYAQFSDGIYPGNNIFERSAWVKQYLTQWPNTPQGLADPLPAKAKELNAVLRGFTETVREHFTGPLTYSSAIYEEIDWTMFDYAGPNYYRETQSDEAYREGLEYFRSFGRPIAIPEFGCCTYKGAAALGARGWRALEGVNEDGSGTFRDGLIPERDETEQADYYERQLRFYDENGVDSAFAFIFNQPGYPGGEGDRDLDRAAYGLVRYLPAGHARSAQTPPWEKKESFHRIGKVFAEFRERQDKAEG